MPNEAIEIQARDRLLIASADSKARRARLQALIPLLKPQIATLDEHAPSYVVAAVKALLAAFERWEREEKESDHG